MKVPKKLGGIYKPKGRNSWRVWISWKGETIYINKALDGDKLDTREKAEIVLNEIQKQIELSMFNPTFWKNGSKYKNEWERRQLEPNYDKVGICGICGEKTKVCQDHCHADGLVRGKLCRNCNLAIGILGENKETLLGAVKYLLFWERQDPQRQTFNDYKKVYASEKPKTAKSIVTIYNETGA